MPDTPACPGVPRGRCYVHPGFTGRGVGPGFTGRGANALMGG